MLASLIKKRKFDWVNSSITEEAFPPQEVRSSDYKLFHFDRFISSDDVISQMQEEGYEPANLYELLSWDEWNGEDWVVALGSVAKVNGSRYVPCLNRGGAGRDLYLDIRDVGWNGFFRFLGVRTSGTQNLETSSDALPLELESAIKKVKDAGYRIIKEI